MMNYVAFISYARADERFAKKMQLALEKYRVPKDLYIYSSSLPNKEKLAPIFRDQDEFPGSSDLGESIKSALNQSKYLIVLLSKASAASDWVNAEVQHFLDTDRAASIIYVVLDGEPDFHSNGPQNCVPESAISHYQRRNTDTYKAEPIWIDWRQNNRSWDRVRGKVIAQILDVGLDVIIQRQKRRQRKALILASMVSIATSLGALLLINNWQSQIQKAELEAAASAEVANIQLVNTLLENAEGWLQKGLIEVAALYALEAHDLIPSPPPESYEAVSTRSENLLKIAVCNKFSLLNDVFIDGTIAGVSGNKDFITAWTSEGNVYIINSNTASIVSNFEAVSQNNFIEFATANSDASRLAVIAASRSGLEPKNRELKLIDVSRKEELLNISPVNPTYFSSVKFSKEGKLSFISDLDRLFVYGVDNNLIASHQFASIEVDGIEMHTGADTAWDDEDLYFVADDGQVGVIKGGVEISVADKKFFPPFTSILTEMYDDSVVFSSRYNSKSTAVPKSTLVGSEFEDLKFGRTFPGFATAENASPSIIYMTNEKLHIQPHLRHRSEEPDFYAFDLSLRGRTQSQLRSHSNNLTMGLRLPFRSQRNSLIGENTGFFSVLLPDIRFHIREPERIFATPGAVEFEAISLDAPQIRNNGHDILSLPVRNKEQIRVFRVPLGDGNLAVILSDGRILKIRVGGCRANNFFVFEDENHQFDDLDWVMDAAFSNDGKHFAIRDSATRATIRKTGAPNSVVDTFEVEKTKSGLDIWPLSTELAHVEHKFITIGQEKSKIHQSRPIPFQPVQGYRFFQGAPGQNVFYDNKWPYASVVDVNKNIAHFVFAGFRASDYKYGYKLISSDLDINRIKNTLKQLLSRCLTPAEYFEFFKDSKPKSWCLEQKKWPYNLLSDSEIKSIDKNFVQLNNWPFSFKQPK